jgi:hypothetical protein
MTLIYLGKLNVPNYTALSTDVAANAIAGASMKGGIVLLTDTAIWKIILDDLTLADYALPISFNGSVDIGAVHLDQQLTDSVEVAPYYNTMSVSVPGTSESLVATDVYAITVTAWPKTTNVGTVYLGTSGVDKTTSQQIVLATGSSGVSIDTPVAYKLNLKNLYIDAVNAGDGVNFMYLK